MGLWSSLIRVYLVRRLLGSKGNIPRSHNGLVDKTTGRGRTQIKLFNIDEFKNNKLSTFLSCYFNSSHIVNCRKSLNRCRTLRLLFSFSGIKQTQTYVEVKLNQFPEVIFPSFEAKKGGLLYVDQNIRIILNTCEPTFCDFGTDAETFRPMKCTLNTGIVIPCILKANRKLGLDTARASTIYEIDVY